MKPRRIIIIMVVGLFLLGLCMLPEAAQAASESKAAFNWKYEVGARSITPSPGRITIWAAQEMKRRSNGQLNLQVYFGTLGYRISNSIRTLGQGLIEGQHVFGDFVAGDVPLLSVMGLPGLVPKDNLMLQQKVHDTIYPRLAEAALKRNVVLLSGYQASGRRIFTSKKLKDLSGLKGLILRAQSPTDVLLTKTVGASPVQVAFTEAEMALRRKTVDGIVTQDKGILDLKLTDIIKTCFDIDLGGGMVWFAFSKKSWDALPPNLQQIAREVAGQAAGAGWVITRTTTDEVYDKYRKAGMTIIELSDDEKELVRKGTAGAMSNWVKRAGPEGQELIDIIKKVIAQQ